MATAKKSTAEKGSSSSEIVTDHVTLPAVTENVSYSVTGHKLNGQNYLQWSQLVSILVSEKGNW